jgi:TPR repeat protein
MYTPTQLSLSSVQAMILCEYPVSTEEFGHCYYDGDGVSKNLDEAFVWYRVAQCAGNHHVDCLINYLDSKLEPHTRLKLISRAKHIYQKALSKSVSAIPFVHGAGINV